MAHMVDSLAWTGQTPWHGLGRELPQHATVSDMIAAGGLDWQVIPRALASFDADGNGVTAGGYKALVRSDRSDVVLSIVTEGYGIVQNAEALAMAEAAVGEANACAEVCGSLDEGRRIFVVLNVKEAGFDVSGERVEPYVVCYTGHDGSTGVGFRFTPVRVVCQNTLSAALNGKARHELTIRHTRNAADRVAQAARMIAQARDYFGAFSQTALALAKKNLRFEEAASHAETLFPTYANRDGKTVQPVNQVKLVELFRRQEATTDHRIAGTAWGFYNAVTALVDHNARGSQGERRMERALAGSDIRDRAMSLLLAA